MRSLTLLISLLLLPACPVPDRADFAGEGDDDDATVDEPVDDDDESPLGPGGSMGIWYWELPPPAGDGVMSGAGFIANFWETLQAGEAGEPVNGPMSWDSPTGADDCAVNVYDEADLETTGGVPGISEERDAGIITLVSPSWSADVEPWPTSKQQSQYYFELDPDYAVHFDTYYEVSVEGADFPAFDSLTDLLVPDALHLIDPVPAELFDVGTGDFVIEWDGGSADEIWIELHHGSMLEFDNASIQCIALNDGQFTIPAAMTQQLPQGELLNLTIGQPRNVTVTVGTIEVDVGSSASATANGMRN